MVRFGAGGPASPVPARGPVGIVDRQSPACAVTVGEAQALN
jgi:hypothetical protein